jgi:hypothetical protein
MTPRRSPVLDQAEALGLGALIPEGPADEQDGQDVSQGLGSPPDGRQHVNRPANALTDAPTSWAADRPSNDPTVPSVEPPAHGAAGAPRRALTDQPESRRTIPLTEETTDRPGGWTERRVASQRTASTAEHTGDREVYADAVDRTARTKPEGGLIGFRASADERRRLRTFLFEVESQVGRVPQQELLRLGLNILMLDWEQRGERSYAAQLYPRLQRR